MERLIADQWAAMGEFDREHKVKLIIDEWGCWHPKGTEINPQHLFEQMGCLRDALVAALTLDTFNRHADKVDMANVAQLVNNLHSLFLADGDQFVATPNFHVFEMYRPHQGAQSVRVAMESPDVAFQAGGKAERQSCRRCRISLEEGEGPDDYPGPRARIRAGRGRDPPSRRRGRDGPSPGLDSQRAQRSQHV